MPSPKRSAQKYKKRISDAGFSGTTTLVITANPVTRKLFKRCRPCHLTRPSPARRDKAA
jgi:hypothetical protein